MRYLRHFPLAVWVFVCAVLGILLYAASLSDGRTDITTPSRSSYDERGPVLAALNRVSSSYPDLAAGDVTGWATETAAQFRTYLAAHEQATGTTDDAIGQAWLGAIAAADTLAAAEPGERTVALARLSGAVQYLAATVDGLVPALPDLGATEAPEPSATPTASPEGTDVMPTDAPTTDPDAGATAEETDATTDISEEEITP